MKGLTLSLRDKLMFTLVNTLILFIAIIAMLTVDMYVGISLILMDFLLAVIVLLAATPPGDTSVEHQPSLNHDAGPAPAVQPTQAPAAAPAAAPATETPKA